MSAQIQTRGKDGKLLTKDIRRMTLEDGTKCWAVNVWRDATDVRVYAYQFRDQARKAHIAHSVGNYGCISHVTDNQGFVMQPRTLINEAV